MTIRFDGQAAIVTGAGRGMGRDIAQMLARRGAKVLVNDYGGAASTLTPGSPDIAQGVADAIVAEGFDEARDLSGAKPLPLRGTGGPPPEPSADL